MLDGDWETYVIVDVLVKIGIFCRRKVLNAFPARLDAKDNLIAHGGRPRVTSPDTS